MKQSHIFFLTLLFFAGGTAAAQDQWENTGELEDVEIEIVRERQITLPKANRNFEKIPPRPSEPIRPPILYDFKPFAFQAAQVNPAIRPLKVRDQEPGQVFGGYVSAGYGNFTSPYLEAFINTRKDKAKMVGAHGVFSSSDKGPVDGKNSGSGRSALSVFGRTFNKYVALSGDVGYEYQSTHFYGYAPGTDVDAGDIRQNYGIFKARGEVTNSKNTAFSYKLGGAFSYLADRYEARESEGDIDFSASLKTGDHAGIGVKAGYYLLSRKDALVPLKPRSLFFVNPRYEFLPVENLRLSAGIVVSVENDTLDDRSIHAYPDLRASYPLSPSVEATAHLTGGIEKVSLQTLSGENIWISPNIPVFHTNKLYELQAALNTRLGNKVALNGGFAMAALKNWYFFTNDAADPSKFVPTYDRGEVLRTNFFASIGYAKAQSISILLRGDAFSYNTDDLTEAWHRPTYKVTADAAFHLGGKLLLDLKLITLGGMKAPDPVSGDVIKLAAAFDLNARVEYMVSKRLSLFAQLNNITGNEYPTFLNYPVRGFQGLGGLTWSF